MTIKTEMKGTGGGRWTTREDAKQTSRKVRRAADNDAAAFDPKPMLKDHQLYMGDNGRLFCSLHAGTSARFTGRDLSGQGVMIVSARMVAEYAASGLVAECETCRRRATTTGAVK